MDTKLSEKEIELIIWVLEAFLISAMPYRYAEFSEGNFIAMESQSKKKTECIEKMKKMLKE